MKKKEFKAKNFEMLTSNHLSKIKGGTVPPPDRPTIIVKPRDSKFED